MSHGIGGFILTEKIKVSSGPIGYSHSYRLLALKGSILHLWCPLSLRYLMIQVKWTPEEVHQLGILYLYSLVSDSKIAHTFLITSIR